MTTPDHLWGAFGPDPSAWGVRDAGVALGFLSWPWTREMEAGGGGRVFHGSRMLGHLGLSCVFSHFSVLVLPLQ